MGILAAIAPARTGTVTSGAAVASTDTIAVALLGSYGAFLEIINGNASPDTVTISDASTTAQGAPAAAISKSVTNGTSQVFKILPQQADGTTGLVTVTHSVTSTVTYKLYPVGI
jgi:hypothetical protein